MGSRQLNPVLASRVQAISRESLQFLKRLAGATGRNRIARGDVIGVDIGGSAIKIALVRNDRTPQLMDFAVVPLETGAPEGSAEHQAAAITALKRVVRERGLRGKPSVGMVSGLDVALRTSQLPDMSPEDLYSALLLEAQRLVPFEPEWIALDYERLGDTQEAGQGEFLVATCDRRHLESVRKILRDSGLKPAAVTVLPLAFRSMMRATSLHEGAEVTALFDIGRHVTQLCVYSGDQIRFAREISFGGQSLTDALRSVVVPGRGTVSLSEVEAERLKVEHGIPMAEDEARIANGIPLASVSVMLRPVMERLVRDVWSSFDYFNEMFSVDPVQRVHLTGRGAQLHNLVPYLESVLKVPVGLVGHEEELLPRAGRAAREALQDLGFSPALALDDGTGINLLRVQGFSQRDPVERASSHLTLPRVAMAAGLALVADASLITLQKVDAESRLHNLVQARAAATAQAPDLARLQGRIQALRDQESLRDQLFGTSTGWARLLKDLSLRVGGGMRLVSMRPEEVQAQAGNPDSHPSRRVILEGTVARSAERPEYELASTLRSLMNSPFYSEVHLVESAPDETGRTRFVIACTLRNP